MTKLVRAAALTATLALCVTPALAKGSHPQNHHCKLPDGSMDMKKTHKQCTAAKGTWAKDAPKPDAKPAPDAKPSK